MFGLSLTTTVKNLKTELSSAKARLVGVSAQRHQGVTKFRCFC